MCKKFRCYSQSVPGPLFPIFGPDSSLRALSLGTRRGDIVVCDEESAGRIFALRMARRAYGKRAIVRSFKEDGVAGKNNRIFAAWLMDASGRYAKEVRFAVMAS